LHYDFSFCNNISDFQNELKALDSLIGYNDIAVPNAVSMPFAFALSKGRRVQASFNDIRFYSMFIAYETDMKRFIDNILSFEPIDEKFFNFILNKKTKDYWYDACLYYIGFFFSNRLDSYDGPFPSIVDRNLLIKNLKYLPSVVKTRFSFLFNEEIKNNNSVLLYEFPSNDIDLKSGSVVITNKELKDCSLLFEDKLKIYGV
jgi:hypothetical protein